MRRILAAGAAMTALALGPAAATAAAPQKITFKGVGQVKLGMTFKELREKGLVGKLRRGCPLGQNTRTARLRSPLRGAVNFTTGPLPRRVTDITVTRGARARGVKVGDRLKDIKAKFPRRKVEHSDVFQATFVYIPRLKNIKMMFVIDDGTKKITAIGVPFVALCD